MSGLLPLKYLEEFNLNEYQLTSNCNYRPFSAPDKILKLTYNNERTNSLIADSMSLFEFGIPTFVHTLLVIVMVTSPRFISSLLSRKAADLSTYLHSLRSNWS